MARTNRRQHGEGSVYRRDSDDRWVAVADLGWKNGKRDRRGFYGATPEQAIAARTEFLDRRRGGFTLPKGRPPTLGEWAHHVLHGILRARVLDTTWPTYRSKVELHIIPYFSRTPLTNEEITEEVIEQWHAHLRRAGLSETTIQHCHRLLSQILRIAVNRRRLAYNPATGGEVHAPARDTPEMMPPDEDEVHAILLECEDRRSGPRWITGLATGARCGETLGLLWPYVDLEEGTVSIEWELVRLPWSHGCDDPHACGADSHRYPCPRPCPKARPSGRQHVCAREGDETGRMADAGGRVRKLCPPGCAGHAAMCPQRWRPSEYKHDAWRHGCQDPHACGAAFHCFPCPEPCPKAARANQRHVCTQDGGLARSADGTKGRPCPPGCTAHAASCPQRTGGGLVLKRPKSEKSRRVVPVGRSGVAALRRQRQLQLEERLALGPEWSGWAHSCDARPRRRDVVCLDCRAPFRPDALVFSQPNGRPVDPRADWGEWLEVLEAAGVDRYRRHDGRHYAATSLLEGAVDIRVVQELLGHATPDFTRRAYQHVRPALARDAAEVLDRALRGGRG